MDLFIGGRTLLCMSEFGVPFCYVSKAFCPYIVLLIELLIHSANNVVNLVLTQRL